MTTAKPFPHWNDGSVQPPNEMLEPVSRTLVANTFFIDLGDGLRTIGRFVKSKKRDGKWFQGYWNNGEQPVRWMQLPE